MLGSIGFGKMLLFFLKKIDSFFFIYIFCCDLENKIENVYFGIYLSWFVGCVTFEKTFSTLKRGKGAHFCVGLMAPP